MKKCLSLAIALMMVAALGVTAFASTTEADNWGNIFYDVPKANVTPPLWTALSPPVSIPKSPPLPATCASARS